MSYIGNYFLSLTGVDAQPVYFGYNWVLGATFAAAPTPTGKGTKIVAYGTEVIVTEEIGVVAEIATDFLAKFPLENALPAGN